MAQYSRYVAESSPTYHLFTKSWNSALNIAGSFGGGCKLKDKFRFKFLKGIPRCVKQWVGGNLLHWRCNQVAQILPWVVCCQNHMLCEEKNTSSEEHPQSSQFIKSTIGKHPYTCQVALAPEALGTTRWRPLPPPLGIQKSAPVP